MSPARFYYEYLASDLIRLGEALIYTYTFTILFFLFAFHLSCDTLITTITALFSCDFSHQCKYKNRFRRASLLTSWWSAEVLEPGPRAVYFHCDEWLYA